MLHQPMELVITLTLAEFKASVLRRVQSRVDFLRWKPKKRKKVRKGTRQATFQEILLEREIRRLEDGCKRNRTDHPVAEDVGGWAGIFEDEDGQGPRPFYRPGEVDGI